MKKNNSLFVLFLLSFLPFTALAQLVNIEEQRKQIKPGWQGLMDFSFDFRQNTQTLSQFAASASLQYTYRKNTFLLLGDISIIRLRNSLLNQDIINKNFQHFRYNLALDTQRIFTYEFFFQRQQNKIKFIQYRFLIGTGFRIALINSDNVKLFLAPLCMYEREILSDSAHSATRMIKGDIYISFNARINDRLSFFHVTYYQPALWDLGSDIPFERFSDYRLASETEFSVDIVKDKISFSVNLELNYDSRPPDPIKDYPLFYGIKNKISFKF